MFRQIKWGVQSSLITKNEILPVTTFFFQKFCFSQMSILTLFEGAGVLSEGAFSCEYP